MSLTRSSDRSRTGVDRFVTWCHPGLSTWDSSPRCPRTRSTCCPSAAGAPGSARAPHDPPCVPAQGTVTR
jgi:hypothetical protein